MSIRYEHGDLLSAPTEAIVNTVNTRGIMGKGIALQVRQRWPEVDRAYRAACERGDVVLGRMHVVPIGGLGGGPVLLINFPTKDHWRSKSRLHDIEAGLVDLRRVIEQHGIRSIAVPPLGCGHGGLRWSDVRAAIEASLGDLRGVEVQVYPPEGAPAPGAMAIGTERPPMTPTLAGMVWLLDRYLADVLGVTDIEVQKLAYFLGARRPGLRLRFARGHYGPYCEALHHILQRAEGHHLRGYGDRSRPPWEPAAIVVLDGAIEEADACVAGQRGMAADVADVDKLVVGFEGAWGMELLSTVHWLASTEGVATPSDARFAVGAWSQRKNRSFPAAEIDAAWTHLLERGWIDPPRPAPSLFDA